MRNLAYILLLAFSFSQSTFAGYIAVWELPTKEMRFKVEYRDAENIRMSIDEELYLLVKDASIYMVNGDSVTDVKAFRDEIKDWRIVRFLGEKMDSRSRRVPAPDKLEPTGRKETVAGIEGEVYRATITNAETGKKEEREIVLTKDTRMVELKQAMQAISDRNMQSFHNKGFKNMKDAMQSTFPSDVSILRYGEKFHVAEFSEKKIHQDRFQLPDTRRIKTIPGFSDLTTLVRLAAPFSY